jgi:hypothetical protein
MMKRGGGKGEGEWEESELNGFECLLKSTKWRSAGGGGVSWHVCCHVFSLTAKSSLFSRATRATRAARVARVALASTRLIGPTLSPSV